MLQQIQGLLVCKRPVENVQALQSDFCDDWTHRKCINMKVSDHNRLANSDDCFYWPLCSDRLPNLNDSFFLDESISDSSNISGNSSVISDGVISPFNVLQETRAKHPNKFLVAHLNNNSLKSKFMEIYELLNDKIVDLLFISETKLDISFHDSVFAVPGYKLERRDRNCTVVVLLPLYDRIFQQGVVRT